MPLLPSPGFVILSIFLQLHHPGTIMHVRVRLRADTFKVIKTIMNNIGSYEN
jgi:hypothetical protein